MTTPSSENDDFRRWTIGAILLSIAIRLIWNGTASPPALPEEARHWVYGQGFAWGYPGEQPLTPWLVGMSNDLFGPTIFAVRFFAPLCHAGAAWLMFITARHMFGTDEEGPRVGFWAALSYLVMPGVIVSGGFMTADPALMLAWALALYALVRAMIEGVAYWWLVLGVAIGAGFLASPIIVVFAISALGYALVHRETQGTSAGALIAAAAAVAVASPNLVWLAREGAIFRPGQPFVFDPLSLAEFVGGQFAVFGPVLFTVLVVVLLQRETWRKDWRLRLLLWLSLPLVAAMAIKSWLTGAPFQAAAPAYISGAIAACALLVRGNFSKLLQVSTAIGVAIWLGYWSLASLYDTRHAALPRGPDPFKNIRHYEPICKASLASLSPTGSLLLDDPRLLSVCMFEGRLGFDRVALWKPGPSSNRFARNAELREDDARSFVYLTLSETPEDVTEHFKQTELVSRVPFRSHRDRTYAASIWSLQGYTGQNE